MMYNLRSIKQLQKSYPYIQWLDYINALLPKSVKVGEDEMVILSVPSFFEKLGKLLKRTDKRDIANYMMWRIHAYAADFLSENFRKRKLQYTTALTGEQDEGATWAKCVETVLDR